jgi:hypothetical protein
MTDNVKLMFEVETLMNASPATVSRAGTTTPFHECSLQRFQSRSPYLHCLTPVTFTPSSHYPVLSLSPWHHLIYTHIDSISPPSLFFRRAGIIFVSDTDLDWAPVMEAWIRMRPEPQQAILRDLQVRMQICRDMCMDYICISISHIPVQREEGRLL